MTLLFLYAAFAIGISFLCSLLEASLLSIPRTQVESLVAEGSAAGRKMKALKENIDRSLAAILTLNTIAHTAGAAGVGAQAAVTFGDTAVGIAGAAMTLAILIFSEIIPKTLGAVHATRLIGVTAYTTNAMIILCLPIIIPLEWVNRLFGSERHRDDISRMEVLATVRLGREGGALADREHRIVTNLFYLNTVKLSVILTPRTVLFSLPADRTIGEVAAESPPVPFARIPIYRASAENIVGYVTRYDIFRAAADGRSEARLMAIKRPIHILPEQATVGDALERLLESNEHIALVVDEYGGLEGIVTLEDVLETVLGQEIVDETDAVPDMQRFARRLAERREERSKRRR